MRPSVTTTGRGAALNAHLRARGFLPLIDPWRGLVMVYRFAHGAELTERELEQVHRERAVIGEYLRGLR